MKSIERHKVVWTTESPIMNILRGRFYAYFRYLNLSQLMTRYSILYWQYNIAVMNVSMRSSCCSATKSLSTFWVFGVPSGNYLDRKIGIEQFSVLKPLKYACNKCVTLVYWWMTTILKRHYKKHFICVSMQCSGPEHQRCLIRISNIYTAYRVIPV